MRKSNYFKSATVLLLCSFLSVNMASASDIWLSPKGKETNSGSEKSPVKSLQMAAKLLKKSYSEKPFTEATIWLEEGQYTQHDVVVFDRSLFGGNSVKITIASVGEEKARINGGYALPVDKFTKINDLQTLRRVESSAADEIMVVSLRGTGLEEKFAQNTKKGKSWDYKKQNYAYISWGEHLLQVAQWPNRGFAHIDEVFDEGPTTRWLKPGEKPAEYSYGNPIGAEFNLVEKKDLSKWAIEFDSSQDVLMQGYPHNDWFYQQEKVGDITKDEVKLLRYTRYGVVVGKQKTLPRRVKFVNMLCELDEPGEWYFDNASKRFFIYPIEKITKKTQINVLSGGLMIKVDGLDGFTIENVIFENGGSLGVEINNSSSCLIAGSTFRNFNGRAFLINGGKDNGIQSCNFHGLESVGSMSADYNGDKSGESGLHIDAEGSSRETLTPCGHYMVNNDIYDCRIKGYGLIGLNGVGLRFAHNLLHDMNGAVRFSGNDIILEYNEFYNMGWEMGDWNVAYIGADWASFGNEVRYNFVHHLMETPGAYPVEAFRNDDLGMGVKFSSNIFYKSGRGGVTFYGSGNECSSNIAVDVNNVYRAGLYRKKLTDEDFKEKWAEVKRYDDGELVRGDKGDFLWRAERFYGKMGWNFEPYRSKYPMIKKIMDLGRPFSPTYSSIVNNYVSSMKSAKSLFTTYINLFPEETTIEYPEIITTDDFVDINVLNMKLKDSFKPMEGFVEADFDKIGMYADKYRPTPPSKDAYRKAIKDKYEGIPSSGGTYSMKDAYKRFPVPAYLAE